MLATADRAHTAFLSTILNNAPIMQAPNVREAAGATAHVAACVTWLTDEGVHLDAWGMPHAAPPAQPMQAAALPRVCMPKRQRCRWTDLGRRRAQTRSATVPWLPNQGGPEGGAWLCANAADTGTRFEDDEFTVAIRLRLRLAVCPMAPCHRQAAKSHSRTCGRMLDPDGHHAVLCKLGGLATIAHDACWKRLWHAARQTGAFALREQAIPELATASRKEPRVDIETWGLLNEPRGLYDFTICAPFASRYEQQADQATEAAATSAAERRKRASYSQAAGLAVEGLAMDAFGRCGPALAATLARWADLARVRDIAMGNQPRRWLNTWRTQLNAEAAFAAARMVLTANRWPDAHGAHTEADAALLSRAPVLSGPRSQPAQARRGKLCTAQATAAAAAAASDGVPPTPPLSSPRLAGTPDGDPPCDEDLLMEEAAAAQLAQRPPLSESPDSDAEWDAAAFLRPCDARAASPIAVTRLP